MSQIYIKIDYKASGGGLVGIDEFKSSLKDDYIVNIRQNGLPQSWGVHDMLVELVINSPLGNFVSGAIIGGAIWDVVKVGTKKFVLRPIREAFEKLEKENDTLDYWQKLTIKFEDVDLVFYGIERGFFSDINRVFQILINDFDSIINKSSCQIQEIHIPLLIDEDGNFYASQYEEVPKESYGKFWGFSSFFGNEKNVFDVENLRLVDTSWTER